MKISARNTLPATVREVHLGAVNAEVVLELPGGARVTAIITKASAERLGLAVGKPAYAVIKASDVMVGID